MKYLALLSGGKDSCYNLLHCHQNGHELIAAASLGPEPGKEELDSYLYQTVGQDAIELISSALGVPLYRQVIRGSAIEQSSEYGARTHVTGVEGDETEDLYTLLSRIKSHHPDVQGVSVGAILSNYQRVRVEHVCRRLGLTPLCYLWQRDQETLLSEMIDAGVEAIIIKVAGIGLTVDHLGKTLTMMQGTLRKLNCLYGLHICGEGGEYETLTLNCPLFKYKIRLEEVEAVIHSDNDFATVSFLRIKKASLASKEQTGFTVAIPPLLEGSYAAISTALANSPSPMSLGNGVNCTDSFNLPPSTISKGPWVSVTNVQRFNGHSTIVPEIPIEEEVTDCFLMLKRLLSQHQLRLCHSVIINIYLSSIDYFSRANAVYSSFFGTSPPARACVAVDLPHGINVRLECLAFSEGAPSDRQALHVQGLSYWAPANIGPYSQAIMVDERVFISGQIGLLPCSLTLPSPQSLALELALACQHTERISKALSSNTGSWAGHSQLIIYWHASVESARRVRGVVSCHLPSQDAFACTLFVVVKDLPKGASVEKQVIQHTGRSLVADPEDGFISSKSCSPTLTEDKITTQDGQLYWQKSQMQDIPSAAIVVCIRGEDSSSIAQLFGTIEPLKFMSNHRFASRLFYSATPRALKMAQAILHDLHWDATSVVHCQQILTSEEDWDIALCALTTTA